MPDRLFLIDGHALIFKTYYALLHHPMMNSKGTDTSILYGFTKYLLELLDRERPTHLAVVFDPPGGTFRNRLYPAYKANRQATPQPVIDALEPLTQLCRAMRVPALTVPDYEADDVIGTLARRFGREGTEVYMVTPDKDFGQLIDRNVFQLKPGRGGSGEELFGPEEICRKYGIAAPVQVIELLTLCGDVSDNVPGVEGVGEKTAARLISAYGSVEEIYRHLESLTPKQRQKFREAEAHIGLSRDLVTIRTDVPVEIRLEDMAVRELDNPELCRLFDEYEFFSLKRHLRLPAADRTRQDAGFSVEETGAENLMAQARRRGRCALVASGTGLFSKIDRLTLAADDDAGRHLFAAGSPETFRALLEDGQVEKTGYGLKGQTSRLLRHGIDLKGRLLDIELMHYLLRPEQSGKIEMLARHFLHIDMEALAPSPQPLSLFEPQEAQETPEIEAAVIFLLAEVLEGELVKAGAGRLYDEMEEPLIRVLARMERTGVKVDLNQLDGYARELRKELEEREIRIRELAGEPELNISSPKQVGAVLFEKLALGGKTKKEAAGRRSTDEATLKSLSRRHPIVGEILEFRAVKKLLSTYIEPFNGYVSPRTGRIHTTFNQALTATGRLSSSNPNLQNIPVRTERGKEIRKAFVPGAPDGLILSADYSQIELRLMAHLSGDAHLIQSFREGSDIHTATAAKLFRIPREEVTADQRRTAKTANFGIMYGISAFGLSRRLEMPLPDARRFIEEYFAAFPAIQAFIRNTVAAATEKGYVETLFGRRRYIPELQSRNGTVRALGERNAVNAPIQGTSADIIKLAMIRIDRRLDGMRSRMILQIHDELLFDTLPQEVDRLKALVTEEMENVIALSVPLTVECNYGRNWLEAH